MEVKEEKTVLKGRKISKGLGEGEVVKVETPISFLGGIDAKSGKILDADTGKVGTSIAGKVFVFTHGKGSTVGSYVIYQLKKNKVAPLAIINENAEIIVAVGAIISDIPMVDKIDISKISDGDKVRVYADEGIVEILR